MRIIFFGTPEPAAEILKTLIEFKHEIVYVVTQPDRPSGRGKKIAFSPVKELAIKNSLPVEQPETVKNNPAFTALIRSLNADVAIAIAYGQILPKDVLSLPKFGFINIHFSLLPKYRGAAPIQWALLKGESKTGVSIFKIEEALDTGPILAQKEIAVAEEDNYETLENKLFVESKKLLLDTLQLIEEGKSKQMPQNEADVTYAPSIAKESGEIDWRKSAQEIHNRVRALVVWPTAHTFYQEKRLKILKTRVGGVALNDREGQPGTVVGLVKGDGFIVATGNGNLEVLEVQPEGGKKMSAFSFAIGHDVKIGTVLPS